VSHLAGSVFQNEKTGTSTVPAKKGKFSGIISPELPKKDFFDDLSLNRSSSSSSIAIH
jgi:hypothetical protein